MAKITINIEYELDGKQVKDSIQGEVCNTTPVHVVLEKKQREVEVKYKNVIISGIQYTR